MRSIEDWLNRPGGLARQLRDLRRQSGLTGTELARRLGWTQSKVSKIETGKQMPTDDDVLAWSRLCAAGDDDREKLMALLDDAQSVHREWKSQVRDGQVAIQRGYDDMARRARVIRNVEIVYVPGLLQTADYARSRIAEGTILHGASADEIDAATAQRMLRQQVLYDTTKTFEFVITEAALRLLLCPPAAMLAQLDRLIGLTSMAHIKFGIIPFGSELRTAPQNSFIVFDDEPAVVETFVGETVHYGDEASAFASAMDRLMDEALQGAEARQLVVRAMQDLRLTLG